jgi:aspartate kinase
MTDKDRVVKGRVVIKFGGADLSEGKKIRRAAKMVTDSSYREILVVVSATARTTNNLIELISGIGDVSDREYADIVSMGERTSARLFSSALKFLGRDSIYLEPTQESWPIITDANYRNAIPDLEKSRALVKRFVEPLLNDTIPVVCGFIGRDEDGNITTLGRGGSDTTALLLANCLSAEEAILVKETQGVMSGDPSIIAEASVIRELDIYEMFALAHGGAKIIKEDSLKYKLPYQKLRVVSFSEGPESEGTIIKGVFVSNSFSIEKRTDILSISIVHEIRAEDMSKIFLSLGKRPIFGVSTGRGSSTIFTSSKNTHELIRNIHNLNICKAISHRNHIALIELASPSFIDSPGWIAKISSILASRRINIIEITTSKATINIFIDESQLEEAINALRETIET